MINSASVITLIMAVEKLRKVDAEASVSKWGDKEERKAFLGAKAEAWESVNSELERVRAECLIKK